MHQRFAHPGFLFALALLITLGLGACGGKDAGSGGGGGGSSATADGAATPEELITMMRKAADAEDFGQVIPLMHPDHRSAMTFFLGVFPASMMIGMSEGMSGMAAMGGPEEEKKAKDKIATMKKGWEDLLAKHKIDLEDNSEEVSMKAMSPSATVEERREALKGFNKILGHVDHVAFINESMAFLKSISDEDEEEGSDTNWDKFNLEDVDIQIDGDTATLSSKKDDSKLGLVKHEGRWYIDLATME